ncbi:alpha/beta fold hydrolase [Desertibacillus haloalkaliphilus]|uniref:alpha/beta fold hydrolase n=1 Tax=Desertibacillus haloalkaliphilus TaxID=1328930 RepID=UPI001C25C340|nr:alpha/beta fold hydrolase [Desertibacillus haloalkaliphilus]MBU8907555.1 alpha/beta fold hydrolase [Desertibacillus haloalkaliphilus]
MTKTASIIPTIDIEKEWKRWNRFFNILNEPEPNVGQTPKQAIWKKNKSTLWYYPATEKKVEEPLFIVYSLFNKPFILDLTPETSIIKGLVDRGYDVYLLDWGEPSLEDKDLSLEDYIVDYLQNAVKRALRHSGAQEISMMGYCLGGTIAAMYAAIADEPIKNLMVAAVPIDFSVTAGPDTWMQALKDGRLSTDRLIDVYEMVPPQLVDAMFRSVSAPIYFSPYVTLFHRAYDERFVDKWRRLNKWTREHVPFTGAAFRQLANDLMKENKLVNGEFVVRGKKVDLANITTNLLVVSSANDHLIPEEQSLPFIDLVSSEDKTYKLVDAGHVSLALTGKFAALLDDWLSERSQPLQLV